VCLLDDLSGLPEQCLEDDLSKVSKSLLLDCWAKGLVGGLNTKLEESAEYDAARLPDCEGVGWRGSTMSC